MNASYTIDASGREQGDKGCRVPWWSFTKTLIAIASLRAAELGVLTLDDPAAPHGATLRQLLRHESGLPDYGSWPDYHKAVAAGGDPWLAAAVVNRGVAAQTRSGDWRYSNIGYSIAREILVNRTGRSLGEALSELVFAPAGVQSASVAESSDDLLGLQGVTQGYHPGWVYHGLVVGELSDAARILRALLEGALLGPKSLDEMQALTVLSQVQTAPWQEAAYGIGLMAPTVADGSRLYGHTGGGPGSCIAVYGLLGPNGPVAVAAFSDQGADVERCAVKRLGCVPARTSEILRG